MKTTIMRFARNIGLMIAAVALTACSALSDKSSYEQGLKANVTQYRLFNATQTAQLLTIQSCYQYATNKTECSIILAGTAPVQTLGGKPAPLRVAKSPGEIFETVTTKGFEAAVAIYGIDAVKSAYEAQAAANAAVQTQQASGLTQLGLQNGENAAAAAAANAELGQAALSKIPVQAPPTVTPTVTP